MFAPSRLPAALAPHAIVCAIVLSFAASTMAESNRVVAIEEHWELRLGQPDENRAAPQTTMVISPKNNLDGLHFLFTINHATVPDYQPGGLQVQLWDGETFVNSASARTSAFSYNEEVVRWVHRLSLEDGTLNFQVRDGQSDTWGEFGGDELSLSTQSSLSNLNAYRPSVSLNESQVSYGENRVISLTLMKLVWVTEDGDVHELNAPIALDTSLDP